MFFLKFSFLLYSFYFLCLSFFKSEFDFFACDDSLLAGLLLQFDDLVFVFLGDVHDCEGIFDVVEFDVEIEGSICWKAGSMIDLKYVWFCFVIEHDVEP